MQHYPEYREPFSWCNSQDQKDTVALYMFTVFELSCYRTGSVKIKIKNWYITSISIYLHGEWITVLVMYLYLYFIFIIVPISHLYFFKTVYTS